MIFDKCKNWVYIKLIDMTNYFRINALMWQKWMQRPIQMVIANGNIIMANESKKECAWSSWHDKSAMKMTNEVRRQYGKWQAK